MCQYYLNGLVTPEGWFYLEIRKCVPVLKQTGRIANEQLTSHLEKFVYCPCKYTLLFCKKDSLHVTFLLLVDNFVVKYVGKNNAEHLISALLSLYIVTEDWEGSLFN